jgi:hypothetical protein
MLVVNRTAIESILSPLDDNTRSRVLLGLAAKFCGPAKGISEREMRIYDEIVCWQAEHHTPAVRARLADCLAHVEEGPVRTIRSLADDPRPEVAGPVLRHSPLIDDDHLCEIARSRGEDHLCAVAERRGVSEAVTETLVGRAMWPILRAVSANSSARLSRRSLAQLAQAARGDGQITTALLKRKDLSQPFARMLVERLRAQPLAEQILRRGEDSGLSLPELIGAEPPEQSPASPAGGSPVAPVLPAAPDLALAEARVEALGRCGTLGEGDIVWCLQGGRWTDALVVIARLASQPTEFVVQTFELAETSYSLTLMRLAGLSWYAAEKVLRHQAGGDDPGGQIAHRRQGYERLSQADAERILRLIRFRQNVRILESEPEPRQARAN